MIEKCRATGRRVYLVARDAHAETAAKVLTKKTEVGAVLYVVRSEGVMKTQRAGALIIRSVADRAAARCICVCCCVSVYVHVFVSRCFLALRRMSSGWSDMRQSAPPKTHSALIIPENNAPALYLVEGLSRSHPDHPDRHERAPTSCVCAMISAESVSSAWCPASRSRLSQPTRPCSSFTLALNRSQSGLQIL